MVIYALVIFSEKVILNLIEVYTELQKKNTMKLKHRSHTMNFILLGNILIPTIYFFLKDKLKNQTEALIIRTLPNDYEKQHRNYSETNPPYLSINCIHLMNDFGVKNFLIDLPSVDRESDGGKLVFHHAFWQVPENPQFDKTITEFVYVEDGIKDGSYILNLQTAPFENDATPSRPVVYRIH